MRAVRHRCCDETPERQKRYHTPARYDCAASLGILGVKMRPPRPNQVKQMGPFPILTVLRMRCDRWPLQQTGIARGIGFLRNREQCERFRQKRGQFVKHLAPESVGVRLTFDGADHAANMICIAQLDVCIGNFRQPITERSFGLLGLYRNAIGAKT